MIIDFNEVLFKLIDRRIIWDELSARDKKMLVKLEEWKCNE